MLSVILDFSIVVFSQAATTRLLDFSIAIVVGGAAVTAYWGAWWKRQKGYFYIVRSEPKKDSPR